MTNSNGSGNGNKQLLSGNTVLDKLLNQLPKDDRELVLRLMTELGIKADDPTHPLLVAMQYYVSLLRDIPEEMKASAKESLQEAIMVYGTIQSQINDSATKIKGEVGKIDSIRVQWGKDTKDLLPDFQGAFDEALKTATAAYNAKISEIAEDSLQEWAENLETTRKGYLRDVVRQGLFWASGVGIIALLAVGGVTYWLGTQHGRDKAIQNSYAAFGGQSNYEFAKRLMNRSDNVERFIKCQEDGNEKCTVWMKTPSQ